jgi:hypothetical protein
MEEQKKFKMPYVKSDTIFTIDISGSFMKKCQSLLIAYGQQEGQEKLTNILEKFKSTQESPQDLTEATIFIMMALVGEMETQALKQNKVEYKELTEAELGAVFNKAI